MRGRLSVLPREDQSGMRRTLDGSTPTAPQVATRPLRQLAYCMLPVLLLLHVDATRADNCDQLGLPQICTSSGEFFCGGDRIAGCLHATACCPDAGCCLTSDENGVLSASCCPSGPDYTGTCNGGQCEFACNRPCGSQCCLPSLNEVCIPPGGSSADGTCCPVLQVCGVDTASPSCCQPPNVCTPAGTCCVADQVCGNDCVRRGTAATARAATPARPATATACAARSRRRCVGTAAVPVTSDAAEPSTRLRPASARRRGGSAAKPGAAWATSVSMAYVPRPCRDLGFP